MNTTVRLKASEITKDWHVIDAAGRPLGRVASEAAVLLRGKHKPTFEPHLDGGDFVIVVNAAQVRVTGRKSEQINYYSHSGFPGGLKTRPYAEQLARYPERVLEKAIWGMLPKGPLGKKMFKHLKVYKGPKHPHQSQLVGSERARAARDAAFDESLGQPMKVARLRPLGGVAPAAPAPGESRAATIETELELQPAAGVVLTSETPPKEGYGTPTPAEAAVAAEAGAAAVETAEKPKRAPRKKAAEATPPAAEAPPTTDETPAPKPRARRKAAAAQPSESTADAPAESKHAESEE